jgi:hypothetical protein
LTLRREDSPVEQRKPDTVPSTDNPGPYVQVAAFCERAIIDRESGLLSLIGIVDQITQREPAAPETPGKMPEFSHPVTLAVCVWGGDVVGNGIVSMLPIEPDGRRLESLDVDVEFGPDKKGINIVQTMVLRIEEQGQYWFDVLFRPRDGGTDRLLSRIPLEVQFSPGE